MSRTEKLSRFTTVSLALNAGLIAFLLFAARPDSSPATQTALGTRGSDRVRSTASQESQSTANVGTADWKTGLRQSNIPSHVFIAAIQADFNAKWNPRDSDLQKRYTDGEVGIEELSLFNLDREIALEATMRDALGEDAFREWDRNRKFADINTVDLALSGDESNALHNVRTARTDRLRALERSMLTKEIDPATYRERCELVQADYEHEVRNLVGFQRYNLARDSGIPAYLRRDLRGLGVSDAQLNQIQELEGNFGDGRTDLEVAAQYGSTDSVKLDHEQAALAQSRDEQLQKILGEEAYALYRKQADARYQTMVDSAANWKLTKQDVENVFQLVQSHESESRRIKLAGYASGRPPAEIQTQVAGLREKLNDSLLRTLSTEQAENLKRNGIVGP
jgi:hypothetical protein